MNESPIWLVEPYTTLYNNLRKNIDENYTKMDKELFNLHDTFHCINVEKMIKAIVKNSDNRLSDLDKFILSCAAWIHDVGMNSEIAKNYFAEMKDSPENILLKDQRKEHHYISCWFLQKSYKKLFNPIPTNYSDINNHLPIIARVISLVIKYHRKIEDIRNCEKTRSVKGKLLNTSLLSAILRLAVLLHQDSDSIDLQMYSILQIGSYDRASRLHWLKSFFVSNIHLNKSNQTITIDVDVPDFVKFLEYKEVGIKQIKLEKRNWNDRVNNLEYIIKSDIKDDLLLVNEIFSQYGFPTYVEVKINTSPLPGFDKDRYAKMKDLLSELDIIFSPNTSKVIKRTLESLKTFADQSFDSVEDFEDKFDLLRNYIKEIYKYRPCHVALGKIIEYLNKIYSTDSELGRKKNAIKELANRIDYTRLQSIISLIEKDLDKIIPNFIDNIFLFGYSSTVITLLTEAANRRNLTGSPINIFILECATKRRLTHSNQIEYNDGIHYSDEISKIGNYNINIIPDAGFATILNKKHHDDQSFNHIIDYSNSLVLIGTNGIDENDGTCGHTSGHLGLAIIAKNFNIPVKVVSDSFKIGQIKWEPTAPRESDWLTTQKNLIGKLSENNINIINYREDRIPIEYITNIHTENGSVTCIPFDRDKFNSEFDVLKNKAKEFDSEIMQEIDEILNINFKLN